MSGLVSSLVASSSSYVKAPLCAVAEKAATGLLKDIANGTLTIHTADRTYCFGEDRAVHGGVDADADTLKAPKAELTVRNPVFWLRLCAMGDLGFAEAYMYGEIDCDDLAKVFLVFLANRAQLSTLDNSLFSRLMARMPQLGLGSYIVNTVANARKNISAHYDISNNMFMGFLSKDMTYSCAIFPELDGDLHSPSVSRSSPTPSESRTGASTPSTLAGPDDAPKTLQFDALSLFPAPGAESDLPASSPDALEAAQFRKLRHILRKADIRPGHRILEIGSGWGALSILVTSTIPGTTVDTLTLSTQQMALANARAQAAGVAGRVRVHLLDYRDMPPEWEGAFDRVVSVEMVEAVGREYMETYWEKIDWALNKETGVGVVQGITIPEARFEQYMREVDFIRKWVRTIHTHQYVSPIALLSPYYRADRAPPAVFPGGFLPTLAFLIETLTTGSRGRLVVDAVANIGPHYARTLREWRRRFEARFEDTIVPALKAEYPGVMDTDDAKAREEIEVFRRKWIYY
ncbi:Tuberculostearic acid methyltransferase UfaA1 [Trametes pubescens]|uniref:Tuberculostearic acid methyltransferase UfaA1 n=1 Tax=Trametes pubescens TaxID=154538 RepID=A0A1M2VSY8_TRAPU|nr:Tuberculostearic acid methyltransferase UfaA1 [Trametes pubescens]